MTGQLASYAYSSGALHAFNQCSDIALGALAKTEQETGK
jgi:hypothetical protein